MDFQMQAILNAVIAIVFMMLFLIVFGLALQTRSLLDRYRLKYSFDRDIELKHIDGKTEIKRMNNLDRRFKAFKRRTLTD
jgi:hypothetical protein